MQDPYQRMVMQMFEAQIGRNMEPYIDDMVIKSKQVEEHLANLGMNFSVLREHKLWVNVLLGSTRANFWVT